MVIKYLQGQKQYLYNTVMLKMFKEAQMEGKLKETVETGTEDPSKSAYNKGISD